MCHSSRLIDYCCFPYRLACSLHQLLRRLVSPRRPPRKRRSHLPRQARPGCPSETRSASSPSASSFSSPRLAASTACQSRSYTPATPVSFSQGHPLTAALTPVTLSDTRHICTAAERHCRAICKGYSFTAATAAAVAWHTFAF